MTILPQKTVAPTVQDQGPSPRRAHILVVDDDPSLRQMHEVYLTRSGFAVDTAADGVDAWQALRGRRYDLLITDHQMPRLTGLELIQKLRSAAMMLPVILASGDVPTGELNRLPDLKIEAVVKKPCPLEEFMRTVHQVLATIGVACEGSASSPNEQSQAPATRFQ
jgi:DNA-binding response OmpR family regulator